jgi:hypothetical protein
VPAAPSLVPSVTDRPPERQATGEAPPGSARGGTVAVVPLGDALLGDEAGFDGAGGSVDSLGAVGSLADGGSGAAGARTVGALAHPASSVPVSAAAATTAGAPLRHGRAPTGAVPARLGAARHPGNDHRRAPQAIARGGRA